MTQTVAEIERHLYPPIALIIHDYLRPKNIGDSFDIAEAGHGEWCLTIKSNTDGFAGACVGNHPLLAKMIAKRPGPIDFNPGFYCACERGSVEMVEVTISCGATDLAMGLYFACRYRHHKIIALLLALGASTEYGLLGAEEGGHHDLIALMKSMTPTR